MFGGASRRPWHRVLGGAALVLLLLVVPSVSADGAGAASPSPGAAEVTSPSPGGADTLPPATVAAGADERWYGTPVSVTLTAADEAGGSGVAYTEYKLDDADWVRGTLVTLPAPADHSGDGPHTILYRSADVAGNLEEAHKLTIGIDTRRPRTRAPFAATVMRYQTATLNYKVLDAPPDGGTADVTIRIRNDAGGLVKTLVFAGKPVNTLLSASFTCGLAAGSYRFYVYAADAAGNRQSQAAFNRLKVTSPWSTTLPFRFRVSRIALREVGPCDCPLLGPCQPAPLVDTDYHDEYGVRLSMYDGTLYDHVSAQASYGVRNLVSYNQTGDPFYLARAEAQAQRLIDRKILVGTAWFHPNDFPWPGMTPPWFSALGHGRCLKLFVALYGVTGRQIYMEAAQGTFESFLGCGPSSLPWIVSVDGNGYLWLQEYPQNPPNAVLNGHNTSAYGLYDYYRLTHDERALELFNGALTTVLHYAARFRQPGWISYYSYSRRTAWPSYHQIHINQLLTLYTLTGMTTFARLADTFVRDYPDPLVNGRVRVRPGTYTGLRFDSVSRIIGARTSRVTKAIYLPVTRRERIHYRSGYWYTTTSGPWRGYFLRELAGRLYMPGVVVPTTYDPPRTLVLPAGHTYVGRTFDADGVVTATLPFSAVDATMATVDRRAIVNGVDQVRVAGGPLAGYWLHLGTAVLR
jgi:hypothetical protein